MGYRERNKDSRWQRGRECLLVVRKWEHHTPSYLSDSGRVSKGGGHLRGADILSPHVSFLEISPSPERLDDLRLLPFRLRAAQPGAGSG